MYQLAPPAFSLLFPPLLFYFLRSLCASFSLWPRADVIDKYEHRPRVMDKRERAFSSPFFFFFLNPTTVQVYFCFGHTTRVRLYGQKHGGRVECLRRGEPPQLFLFNF